MSKVDTEKLDLVIKYLYNFGSSIIRPKIKIKDRNILYANLQ